MTKASNRATNGTRARPNIVLVLADDTGYGDPPCYNRESLIPMPHVDRLASEGIRFTDAHSPSALCTPTRYGILTGRYYWRTPKKHALVMPYEPPVIEPERLTLPKLLGSAGYRSACIGKWHLGRCPGRSTPSAKPMSTSRGISKAVRSIAGSITSSGPPDAPLPTHRTASSRTDGRWESPTCRARRISTGCPDSIQG